MRLSLLVPALTCVLSAQPAPVTLAQTFNTELPGVNKLLEELKFQEAADKATALVPAQAPTFSAKDAASIGSSWDNARGYMALLKLQANAVTATGQWEKAQEINQKRVDFAKSFTQAVNQGMKALEAPWIKAIEDGKAQLATKGGRVEELEKAIAKFKADHKDIVDKKVTLDKKQAEEFNNVRIPQVQKDETELAEIKAIKAQHETNLKNFPMIQKVAAQNAKDGEALVKEAEESLEKAKSVITGQAEEIKTFNTQQLEKNKKNKKFKIEGNKNWVEAVMNDKTNVTKQPNVRAQAQFLTRILFLEPTNKTAAAALKNLQEGKDAFFVEKKGGKKAKK